MKKLILILTLIFALALCFVACEELGDNSNEGQSINALSNGAPETEEPTTEELASEESTSKESISEKSISEKSTSEEPTSEELTTEDTAIEEMIAVTYFDEEVLNTFFAGIQEETSNDKIYLYYAYKEDYYELKNSGLYDYSEWRDSSIKITVWCNYDYAIDEEWYQSCPQTDYETLNQAFFNEYCSELSTEHFSLLGILQALHFQYFHTAETLNDAINDFNVDYQTIKTLVQLDFVESIEIEYWYGIPRGYIIE